MKILLVCMGHLSIPPPGWGAVETVVYDMVNFLNARGHNASYINNKNLDETLAFINSGDFDVVHIHSHIHFKLIPRIECNKIVVTSHESHYECHPEFMDPRVRVCCLSVSIVNDLVWAGIPRARIFLTPNGIDYRMFYFKDEPYGDFSVYLGRIDGRKRQHLYQGIDKLQFVGPIWCPAFDASHPSYQGVWTRANVHESLTNYTNLVLLSSTEAHPLVCMEALVCGLGLVLSSAAAANLKPKPWITIIPDEHIENIPYVEKAIAANREISRTLRREIRAWAIKHFSWDFRIDEVERIYKNE